MKSTFKQIRTDKNIREKDGFGIVILSSILIASITVYLIDQFEIPIYAAIIILFSYAFWGKAQIRKLLSDWVKKEDIIGELEFSENCLVIKNSTHDESINFNELKSVNLHYNHIKGQQQSYLGIIHNGIAELKLETKNNEKHLFKFLIENTNQLTQLKPIWENLYLLDIFVSEKMGNDKVKCIMFDTDLTDKKS